MSESQEETTLARVRLHWGFFIPVLLAAMLPVLVSFGYTAIVMAMNSTLRQLPFQFPQALGVPRFKLIWALGLAPGCVIALILLLPTWLWYLKSETILTNRRLVYRTGFLSKRSGELPLENVEGIFILESLLGRMCGWGTVTVTSVGGASFRIAFIGSPQSFHSTLQKAVLGAKSSGGRAKQPPESALPPKEDDSRYKPK